VFVQDTGYKTDGENRLWYGISGWCYGFNPNQASSEDDPRYNWRDPGYPQTDDHPVVLVSWNDAQKFLEWLSKKEGRRYRLPTEAEWEYACRAGSTTRYSHGDDPEGLVEVGNVADGTAKSAFRSWETINAEDGHVFTAPVGSFRSNAFGLYDMHGNVWEWCSDWYDRGAYGYAAIADPQGVDAGSFHVLRGGSWYYGPNDGRCADRLGVPVKFGFCSGFRLVLE
jgi:formylglycine-generating enzyme required for sulfatase activity